MSLSPKEFEDLARRVMSRHFGIRLLEKELKDFPKRFDLVSVDDSIVGDAKYLTLVQGKKYPPAKMMEITGHVWLLEKVQATTRFLVFGNQREVPELWLDKYERYVKNIVFFFLTDIGELEKLT